METQFMVHFLLMQPFNLSGVTGSIRPVSICKCTTPERINEGDVLLLTYDYNFPGSQRHERRDTSLYDNCATHRMYDDRNCCCSFQATMNVTIYGQLLGNATGAQLRVNGSNRQDGGNPNASNPNHSDTCNISNPNCNRTVSADTNFTVQFLNLDNTQPYSMLMVITAGQTDRGHEPPPVVDYDGKENSTGPNGVTSSDTDRLSGHLIFLIVAAILLVLALAVFIVGIMLFKLSRSRPAKKEADMEQVKPQDTYEDIEGEGGRFILSGKIEKDPPSKGSYSYRRLTEASQTTELSSTLSFDDRASGLSTRANGRTPSPSRSPDLGRPAQGKTSLTGQFLGFQMSTNTNNSESENYYSVENEDYEDIPEPSSKHPALSPGIKVATPFVLAMKSGECFRKLKPVDRDAEREQVRAISSVKAPTPTPRHFSVDDGGTYMGLNRTGRAHSTDLTQSEDYNDLSSLGMGGDKNPCKTADVLTQDSHDSAFAFVKDLKADRRADDAAYSVSYEHGKVFEVSAGENKSSDETGEDHIYEAYDHGSHLKRGSSCLAKSNAHSSEHDGIYELAKLVNDPLQQDLVIIDVRSSKNSNIDERARAPEQCPPDNSAPQTETRISEKLTDELAMTDLTLTTGELNSTISQLTDEIPKDSYGSSSKGARDFTGALADNTIKSTTIPEKSISSPEKSINTWEMSTYSSQKSIDSPAKQTNTPETLIATVGKTSNIEDMSNDPYSEVTLLTNKSNDLPGKSMDTSEKSNVTSATSNGTLETFLETEKSVDTSQKPIDILQKSFDTSEKSVDTLHTQGISPVLTDVESNIETRDLHAVNNVAEPGETPSQTEVKSNTSLQVSAKTLVEHTADAVRSSGISGSHVPLLTDETITLDEPQDQDQLHRTPMAGEIQDQLEIQAAPPDDMADMIPDVQTHRMRFRVPSGDVSSHTYTLLEPFDSDDSAT